MKKKLIRASAFVVVTCAPALADDTYSLVTLLEIVPPLLHRPIIPA
jgi:hypothetical protein